VRWRTISKTPDLRTRVIGQVQSILGRFIEDRVNAYQPMTQGKIKRWHQTLKNRILLEN